VARGDATAGKWFKFFFFLVPSYVPWRKSMRATVSACPQRGNHVRAVPAPPLTPHLARGQAHPEVTHAPSGAPGGVPALPLPTCPNLPPPPHLARGQAHPEVLEARLVAPGCTRSWSATRSSPCRSAPPRSPRCRSAQFTPIKGEGQCQGTLPRTASP